MSARSPIVLIGEAGASRPAHGTKFDMYEGIAFDTRPVLVAPPFTPISLVDGLGCVLPTEIQGMAEDRGDDDVAARLERAALGSHWIGMKSSISSAKKNGACWSGDHVRHRVEFNGILGRDAVQHVRHGAWIPSYLQHRDRGWLFVKNFPSQ